MTFTWPDPISLIADAFTLLGVPTLVWSTQRLWRDFKKEQAEAAVRRAEAKHREIVSQGCLEFEDTRQNVAINLIPFEKLAAVPRPGDFVMLPGETHNGQTLGADRGEYEVERVSFIFEEAPEITDQPCPAVPSKIIVYVHRRERK